MHQNERVVSVSFEKALGQRVAQLVEVADKPVAQWILDLRVVPERVIRVAGGGSARVDEPRQPPVGVVGAPGDRMHAAEVIDHR